MVRRQVLRMNLDSSHSPVLPSPERKRLLKMASAGSLITSIVHLRLTRKYAILYTLQTSPHILIGDG